MFLRDIPRSHLVF